MRGSRTKTKPASGRKHHLALGLALAAILVGAPSMAMAQMTIVPNVNSEAGMTSAVGDANNPANATGTEIQITGNINITSPGADQMTPFYWIYGNNATAPPNAGAMNNPITNITVSGQTTGQFTLSNSSGKNVPVLGIINTTGTVTVENLKMQGGSILNGAVQDGNDYYGAGLYIGAVNTTIDIDGIGGHLATHGSPFSQANVNNVTLSGNKIELTAGAGQTDIAAGGGGLFVDGSNYSAAEKASGAAEFTRVNAQGNSIKVTGNAGAGVTTVQGGGIRVKNVTHLEYTGGLVSGNEIEVINGSNAHGGGMSFDDNSHKADISEVTFRSNTATVSGSGAGAANARGGGLFVINEHSDRVSGTNVTEVNLTKAAFNSNTAHAKDAGNIARGGGFAMVGAGTASFTDGTSFTGNKALADNGATLAQGGAIYTEAFASGNMVNVTPVITINSVQFANNQATASAAAGEAYGGAVYTLADFDSASGNTFTGNQATAGAVARGGAIFGATDLTTVGDTYTGNVAQTTDAAGVAMGGALFAQGAYNVANAKFSGNKALASSGGKAYGGGMYAGSGQTHQVTNSSFTGNEATTDGGAIFVDTKSGATSTLNLEATASGDQIVISGNTADGKADGIYFGSSDLTNTAAGRLNITGQGLVQLLDPVTADLNNQAFTFDKSNAGELHWGGTNVLNSGTGGSNINLTQGKTVFMNDFTVNVGAGGSALKVNVAGGGNNNELGFDASRSNNLAIFDYTGTASTSTFLADTDTTVSVYGAQDGGRQILDVSGSYILAANTEGHAALDNQLQNAKNIMIAGQGVTGFEVDNNNNLIVNVNYANPEQARVQAGGANTWSARFALQELVSAQYGVISDQDFAVIRRNYNAVTPEYGMIQGRVSLDTTINIFEKARLTGLNNYWKTRQGESVPSAGSAENGFRLWAGYIGNFQDVDRNGGYLGYKADTNGAIFGVNYDFSENFSLGLMGGVTTGTTELDRINSEVDSDGVHIGLMASVTPPEVPALGIYFDLGYSSYENDGFRRMEGYRTYGSFDQDVITAGLGVEYVFNVGADTLIAPYLNLRYTSLEQDGFRETGLTANLLSGYDLDSFTSELGARLSRKIDFDGGSFTPQLNLGWRHEYGDRAADAGASFINPATGGLMPDAYNLSAVSVDRDMANIGLGGELMFDMAGGQEFGFTVDYNVLTSGSQTSQSVSAAFELRF